MQNDKIHGISYIIIIASSSPEVHGADICDTFFFIHIYIASALRHH